MNELNKIVKLVFVTLLIVSFSRCKSQVAENVQSNYEYRSGDVNGIGKWYMGREIARVMGYQGMSWLERDGREDDENTSELIDYLDIEPSDTIADIGAGSGYHVFKISPLAKEGLIVAVDIQPEMLEEIQKKSESNDVRNIKLVRSTEESVNLEPNSVDKILMVDVYHEFSHPKEMLQSIKTALKPKGKIYLVEYKAEDPSIPIKRIHKMSEAQAVNEFKAAGFILENNYTNLPRQHCMVFVKE